MPPKFSCSEFNNFLNNNIKARHRDLHIHSKLFINRFKFTYKEGNFKSMENPRILITKHIFVYPRSKVKSNNFRTLKINVEYKFVIREY